jgi:hypothetical protein
MRFAPGAACAASEADARSSGYVCADYAGAPASLLLLYCCFTAALLLLYCCFTAALLLLYCNCAEYAGAPVKTKRKNSAGAPVSESGASGGGYGRDRSCSVEK